MKIIPIYITNERVRAFDKAVCGTPELRDELCRVNNVGDYGIMVPAYADIEECWNDIDTLLGRYGFQRDKDYHF